MTMSYCWCYVTQCSASCNEKVNSPTEEQSDDVIALCTFRTHIQNQGKIKIQSYKIQLQAIRLHRIMQAGLCKVTQQLTQYLSAAAGEAALRRPPTQQTPGHHRHSLPPSSPHHWTDPFTVVLEQWNLCGRKSIYKKHRSMRRRPVTKPAWIDWFREARKLDFGHLKASGTKNGSWHRRRSCSFLSFHYQSPVQLNGVHAWNLHCCVWF